MTGLGVKTKEFKRAAGFWRLNLFAHAFIFVYHPCVGIALTSALGATTTAISPLLLDGLMIVMCLPSAISSSVVLTANSNGNEAAAVVNAAVSNLLGIALTPGLIFVFLGDLGNIDFGAIFIKLSLRVVLPVLLIPSQRNTYPSLSEKYRFEKNNRITAKRTE